LIAKVQKIVSAKKVQFDQLRNNVKAVASQSAAGASASDAKKSLGTLFGK